MSKTERQRREPARPGRRRSASTGSATTCSPRRRTAHDGDFTYEGLIGRYNSDLANNLGNLLARVATVVGKKCGGVGPAPRADSPLAAAAAAALRRAPPRRGTTSRRRGARRHVVADPRHQRLPRGERAVEGRARPGGRRRDGRRARGAAHRGHPRLPGRAADQPGDLGADRLPGDIADQRLPDAAAWGGYPGGLPVAKGDPLFPRIQTRRDVCFDSHCHVYDTRMPGGPAAAIAAARAAGVSGMITVGCDRDHVARRDRRRRRAPRRLGHRRPAPARGGQRRRHDRRPARHTRHRRRRRVRARLLLRPLAPRRPARGVRRADPARPRAPAAARDPHPRRVGRHVRRARRRGRARADDLPLLHRRPRRGRALPRPRRVRQLLAASSRSRPPPTCARPRRAVPARPPAGRDRQPRTWRRCPTAAAPTSRRSSPSSASASPTSATCPSADVAAATVGQRGVGLSRHPFVAWTALPAARRAERARMGRAGRSRWTTTTHSAAGLPSRSRSR